MIIPWGLIGRLVASAVAGILVLRLRGVRGDRLNAAVDLVVTLAIGAAVGGRLAVLLLDALLIGTLPDVRAIVTLGPGLSVPGALVGAGIAGWRHHRQQLRQAAGVDRSAADDISVTGENAEEARSAASRRTWQDAGLAVAVGLATFSAVHLPAVLPANLVRVTGLTGVAVWLARGTGRWHGGPRLLTGVAGVHLLAAALTPSLPTVDTDLDLLATTAVLLGGLLTSPRVGRAGQRLAGVVGAVVGSLVLVGVMTGSGASPDPLAVDPALTASLDGAIVAGGAADGGPPTDVPAWGGEELAALVRDSDLPVVVNLWAAWCPPCHAEAATVARAARALEGRALVLGVLVDDGVADGQAFADTYGLTFPTVVDDGISDALGMVGLPTTVVLDTEGGVVRRVVGGLSQATLAQAVEAASRG